MRTLTKTDQLQLRVSKADKAWIQRSAKRAGQDMSSWLLGKILAEPKRKFALLTQKLSHSKNPRYDLAELNDLLAHLSAVELRDAVEELPRPISDRYLANYVAAMVEVAAHEKEVEPPRWTRQIAPLAEPHFVGDLSFLRLHLLLHSPPPFRARNIYIDSTVGDRV